MKYFLRNYLTKIFLVLKNLNIAQKFWLNKINNNKIKI